MHTFFTAISQALTDSNKRINIDVSGLEGGRVKVVLSANIGPTPAKASEAEIKLRAAIAKPMMLSGTPEEVETALFERVRSHAEVVNHGMSALDEIRKLSEAAVQAAKPAPSAPTAAKGTALQQRTTATIPIWRVALSRQPSRPPPLLRPKRRLPPLRQSR
ncbi:PRTRC system protein E [Pseudomonas aeruginosa]|nr:PRTRC system protein E [Pseudomonas aeruginosa]